VSADLLRFYVPLDTKQVISETFFPADILALKYYWRNQYNKSKQHRTSASAGMQDANPTIRP